MKRAIIATALASLLALFAFFGLTGQSAAADNQVLPNVTLPAITVTVPRLVTITAPGQTVTLPRATLTLPRRTVTVPGPVQTITVSQEIPGQSTVTVTKTVAGNSNPAPQQARPTSGTLTVTSPGRTVTTPGQTTTAPGSTKTVSSERIRTLEKRIPFTVPQFVGISAGLILLGAVAGLLLLALYYALGYKDAERKDLKYIEELRGILRR